MGKIFTLDPGILTIAADAFDDLIDQLGKPCKVVYTAKETNCPNCLLNPKTGISTGRYKSGGPIPFPTGTECPVCNGKGKVPGTEGFDIINLLIDWNPKPWQNLWGETQPDSVVRLPGGIVSVRGYMADLPKVLKADYIVLDINNNFMNNHFVLQGEPTSPGNIVKNRYFSAIFKRSA